MKLANANATTGAFYKATRAVFNITTLTLATCLSLTAQADDKTNSFNVAKLNVFHSENWGAEKFTGSDNQETYLSFEYGSDTDWGSFFMFIDQKSYLAPSASADNDKDNEANGLFFKSEIGFDLGKIADKDLSCGPIKNLALNYITTIAGESHYNARYNYFGLRSDLDVPGFVFFRTSINKTLIEKEGDISRGWDGYKLALAWAAPFNLYEQSFVFDGWFDYDFGADRRKAYFDKQTFVNKGSDQYITTFPGIMWRANKHIELGYRFYYGLDAFAVKGNQMDAHVIAARIGL
jgi:nucleoside-specific outer membrane channel protein Tsx